MSYLKWLFYSSLAFVSLVNFSCTSVKQVKGNYESSSILATSIFGKGVEVIANSQNTHALCKKVSFETNGAVQRIEFGVINIQTNKLIYRDEIRDGIIEWSGDTEILINNKAEVYSKDPDDQRKLKYLLNVLTLEKKYIGEVISPL
jgi:hypothetical protein